MMDKIVVTAADIEKLLAWRDEHNDLVRSMPVPLREVEIQIVESGISIKCFRSDKKLKLYLDSPARKLGHVVFAPLGNGLWKKKVSTLPADCNPAETEQGALTVYGSLMALMTYGAVGIRGEKSAASTKAPDKRMGSTKPHTANTTYIIHSAGKQLTVVPRGHHASPACSFTVRGHFRHYKSGKTVWIAEYRKGTGRSRGKTDVTPPTEEDADERGKVLAVEKCGAFEGAAETWDFDTVAQFPDQYPLWMPMPKLPEVEK